jgi:hypothetical protein
MIGRLIAARRARDKEKQPEVSVQQLNEQQKQQQRQKEIEEQQKEDFRRLHASCAVVFAASFILLIIALIVLIPALTYGDEVFFVAFAGFSVSGLTLLLVGCCFNDCCKAEDPISDKEGDEYQETTLTDPGHGFKDSGISLCQSEALQQYYDEIPYNVPVRLEVPICVPLTVRNYYNLPTITT